MGRSEHNYQFKSYNEESIVLHVPGCEHHLAPDVGQRLLLELIAIFGVPTNVGAMAYDRAMKGCSRDVGNATRTCCAETARNLGEAIAKEIESKIV